MLLTVTTVLAIWLLLNVLFVVLTIPPRRPSRTDLRRNHGEREPDPFELGTADDKASTPLLVSGVAMAMIFSLAPLIASVFGIHRRSGTPPDED